MTDFCTTFRRDLDRSLETNGGRAHLEQCDGCYRWAVERDPSAIFALLDVPQPSAVEEETLVRDVMSAITARSHERAIDAESEPPRWAGLMAVAAIIAAILSGLFIQEKLTTPENLITENAATESPAPNPVSLPELSRPVVEDYSAAGATIVELPQVSDEFQLVMIFDDSLPQDL